MQAELIKLAVFFCEPAANSKIVVKLLDDFIMQFDKALSRQDKACCG